MHGAKVAYERSELQTERDEVFDDRQVLGNGTEGGRVRVRPAGEGPEAEVEPRAAGREEGEAVRGLPEYELHVRVDAWHMV